MRALAILAALLVLATPFAASQSDPDPSSGSSSSPTESPSPTARPVPEGNETDGNGTDEAEDKDPEEDAGEDPDEVQCPKDVAPAEMTLAERRACYCEARPDTDGCEREGEGDDAAGVWRRWCREEARSDAQRERCRRALNEFRGDTGEAARVTFEVDPENRTLYDYRIDGRLIFEAILLDTGSDNLTVQRIGSALRIGDDDTELVLHEDPTGLVRFKGSDGSLTARLADGALVQRDTTGEVARITFSDGSLGHLRAGNATWLDGSTILVSDFLAFLLPPRSEAASDALGDEGDDEDGRDVRVVRAIEDRKVGAEIEVSGPASAEALSDGASDGTVKVLAYDDVDVEVNVPSAVATPDAPIRIKVSAELEEGRTIVLKLDRSVLESGDPETLVLRYFDVYDQADGTEVETEVVFAQASDLADVLDPVDDGGQPEYWVVEDANGLQVLISVPHWSAHAITVGSLAQVVSEPSVFIGILVGAAGSVVAAAAMLWPRRPEDDFA